MLYRCDILLLDRAAYPRNSANAPAAELVALVSCPQDSHEPLRQRHRSSLTVTGRVSDRRFLAYCQYAGELPERGLPELPERTDGAALIRIVKVNRKGKPEAFEWI